MEELQKPATRIQTLNGRSEIKVLMYHRLIEHQPATAYERAFCVNVDVFRKHLRMLERLGYTAITFNDYHLHRQGKLHLPRKPIILTFDDGYQDTHQLAFPILQEYGMRAVIFILGDRKVKANAWDSLNGDPAAALLTPGQILELHLRGFEIGSHSLTHPKLTEIPDEDAWEQISRSRMLLEILINAPVRSFSYPYGLMNTRLRSMVQEAGYDYACGVYTGPARFSEDYLNIRRITPSGDRFQFGFGVQVATPYQKYSWLRWRVKQFMRNGRDQ